MVITEGQRVMRGCEEGTVLRIATVRSGRVRALVRFDGYEQFNDIALLRPVEQSNAERE